MMQIIELSTQIMARFDTGMTGYAKQSVKKGRQDTQFSDVLSSVREAQSRPRKGEVTKQKAADSAAASLAAETTEKTADMPEEPKKAEESKKAEEPSDTGEPMENDEEEAVDVVAASILAQANVVLILEGNKEIDAAPETQGDAIDGIGALTTEGGAPVVEGDKTPVPQATVPETADDEKVTEQMARMPEFTEKPREAKKESENGELCPLENENEVSDTKSKKDETPRIARTVENKSVDDDDVPERVIPTQQTVDVRPERLSSSEQLKGVAVEQPVAQSNLFEAMVEKIETMQVDGASRMQIQLKPEYLGKVSLQLSMTEAGLQVKINADDLNVKNAIGGQIQALIDSLSSKGIALAEVEVMHTGAGGYDFLSGQGGNAQSQQGAPSKRYVTDNADNTSGFGITLEGETPEVLDEEISSVEYRA